MVKVLTTLCLIFLAMYNCAAEDKLNLIPQPQEVNFKTGKFSFDKNSVIIAPKNFNSSFLQEKLNGVTGLNLKLIANRPAKNYISIEKLSNLDIEKEGYLLNVTPQFISIKAQDDAGIFYAIQTLMQLLPPTIYSGNATQFEKWSVPAVEIRDFPRFPYRGMMLDVSRTFFDKESIIKQLDWLAAHKINSFHWHLTDDNGWRIEIKKYPELTSKGAWRGTNELIPPTFGSGNERSGGFYTQKDVKEIVAYAKERNIEIIPEIDLPGHSKVVGLIYPEIVCDVDKLFPSVQGETQNVWCVGREANYKMLNDIIKEVSKLFPSNYIHIGGDETVMKSWEICPSCQALMKREKMKEPIELLNYFVRRMESIVKNSGKSMAGWDEILDGGKLDSKTRLYGWRSLNSAIEAVKKGQPTVMQVGEFSYLDMKQSPQERGHNWAGIVTLEKAYSFDPIGQFDLTEEQKSKVLGTQVGLWSELLNYPSRFLEYQVYPRLVASAEIGWSSQKDRDYKDFYRRLTESHYERMYQMGIAFRVAPPKVEFIDNSLRVTLPYPHAVVRYTSDKSEPDANSPIYQGQIVTDNPRNFRFATFYKDEFKSISKGAENIELYIYQNPKVTVETNIPDNKRFSNANLMDNNLKSYFRSSRKAQIGDYLIYRFDKPITSELITVESGIPNISFYGVTDGHIEYSYDGINFIKGDSFKNYIATIKSDKPIAAVKIVITGANDAHTLALQDIRVE